ncbi:MAG: haloacid dehalogenase [Dehalococcoidia bacterium]|nr:MAG: haloacid dehalogenase [Dehalococcoidia bacterium]
MIQNSGNAIRSAHRQDPESARQLLDANRSLNEQLLAAVADSDEIRQAGFMHDAQKEYAEACITFALIQGSALPEAADVGVPMPAYLNGLGEAVGELRRFILDSLRRGDTSRCEMLLDTMDDIYGILMAMDYPDTVTHGLRRNSDSARGLIERTRGDLTNALRQDALEARLAAFERRIC